MSNFKGKSYNITEKEEQHVDFWNEYNIFQKSIENNKENNHFIFYDGPPFATGLPHYGHILAGYIKDTISRWATINGYCVPRQAGFDCHGLPIEFEIEKKLGIKTKDQIHKFGIDKYNESCREIVMSCAGEWKSTMTRLGRWIDFDNDYKTMDLDFMSKVWGVFSKIYEKGLIYEGVKIMPYSTACTTPLANFEATSNYQNITDRTVILKFKIKDSDNKYILSWTTTPWTLPSHYCLCINKNITYSLIEYQGDQYYLSKNRIDFLKSKLKTEDINIISEIKGTNLIGVEYEAPYNFVSINNYYVVEDDFVTDDSGTGVVHIAPAFGEDDYNVCIKHKLINKELSSLFLHIDDNGNGFNCGEFNGLSFKEISKLVLKDLQKKKLSVIIFDYEHSYPFCWRSDTPLIYKAVRCWFLNVESIKERMIEINEGINWVPEHVGNNRFHKWLEGTRDWCISRNRYWGTPIPIWKSKSGKILVIKSKEHLEELTSIKITDIHRHHIDQLIINYEGEEYTRDETVLDCWFESGCVPFASPTTGYPADFIAEGLDQTRGWFYTLLVIGTIIENKSPFKNVIVNGLVLASDGKKMSKRLKNYPDPMEVVKQYGADSLRYYLLMSGATMASELRFNNNDVREVLQTVVIPLTNSLSFFQEYYTVYQLNKPFVLINSTRPFDKWILKKLYNFIKKYSELLNNYKINPINDILVKFIDDLNNGFIRLNRDVIKGKDEDDVDKINCQMALSTLYKVLYTLSIYLSPILPFLSETIYQELNGFDPYEKPISVHLNNIEDIDIEKYNIFDDDINMISLMFIVIENVRKVRNVNNIQFKRPLKKIEIYSDDNKIKLLSNVEFFICNEINVIEIEYKKWEATKYKYVYTLNLRNVGKLFKEKKNTFEQFIKTIKQEDLEDMFNGKYNLSFENNIITSDLLTIHQIIEDSNSENIKIEEDIINRIKIKVDINSDKNTEELFIAKIIATNFQRARKFGGFHAYDSLRLVMKENIYSDIVVKYMDYIKHITRVEIEIISKDLDSYLFSKNFEIENNNVMLYLLKN